MSTTETAARTVVFRATGLTKTYGMGAVQVKALRGVDLELYSGELVVLHTPPSVTITLY